VLQLFWNWHNGASNNRLSGRNAIHVPTHHPTARPPPRTLATAATRPGRPRWQHLTAEVQQPLLNLLTRMLQQQLAIPNPADESEVADDAR
jgi:hypothetical protein